MPLTPREHQNFHVGLKAFIEKQRKLLILRDSKGLWELPGGRAEKNETTKGLEQILRRETAEELGKNFQCKIGPIFHAWIRQPNASKDFFIFLVGFKCHYKSGEIILSPEHKDFKWISKKEVGNLKFENTYKEAVEYYFEVC